MAPERRNWGEADVGNEARLVAGVAHRKVEVGLGRHIEHRRSNRFERVLGAATEAFGGADVVPLPGGSLENGVVGVELSPVLRERCEILAQRPRLWVVLPPQLPPPPL